MKRVCFKMKLYPGKEQEYKKRHAEIWPELQQLLTSTGIHEYTICLDPETLILFAMLRMDDPARLDELPAHAIMQKWWAYMSDIMEVNPDNSPISLPLTEVFYMS